MKKYFLLAIYLLTMVAIYLHPIILPNDGTPLPLKTNNKLIPPNEPLNIALETRPPKSAFFDLPNAKEKVVSGPFLAGKMK